MRQGTMGNQKDLAYRRAKKSRSPSAGKLLPIHNIGFGENNDDLESVSFHQSTESLSSLSDSKIPELVCSKYAVIGDPHARKIKQRKKTKYWTMPELGKEKSLLVAESNDRLFDRKNLYGIKQQKRYERLIRDDTNGVSENDCTPRRSVDKEKDYILSDYYTTGTSRNMSVMRFTFQQCIRTTSADVGTRTCMFVISTLRNTGSGTRDFRHAQEASRAQIPGLTSVMSLGRGSVVVVKNIPTDCFLGSMKGGNCCQFRLTMNTNSLYLNHYF
ncbi:uncharacterized protein LOC124284303 [Haliotis rubra]|uniref:uncharacterized protein LOC124284303 n=1 Tax=Haliotis rubra TaxID=36100 RepID=UPI001EE53149|nr:uncharacterized protein LOC124284303 [Haliotis rubra]XP_046576338.1 uncharacterized protein LOC124284303 [Haliotis rubra]